MIHLIEAVRGWVVLGLIAEMPLAKFNGAVASLLKELSYCGSFGGEAVRIAGDEHEREGRANGNAASDEGCAPGGTTGLAVIVDEAHAL
jgi:hypothetical protein